MKILTLTLDFEEGSFLEERCSLQEFGLSPEQTEELIKVLERVSRFPNLIYYRYYSKMAFVAVGVFTLFFAIFVSLYCLLSGLFMVCVVCFTKKYVDLCLLRRLSAEIARSYQKQIRLVFESPPLVILYNLEMVLEEEGGYITQREIYIRIQKEESLKNDVNIRPEVEFVEVMGGLSQDEESIERSIVINSRKYPSQTNQWTGIVQNVKKRGENCYIGGLPQNTHDANRENEGKLEKNEPKSQKFMTSSTTAIESGIDLNKRNQGNF